MSGRNASKPRTQRISISKRAGTMFPCSRIRRYLKGCTFQQRIGMGAPIYQAAVLEYLTAEILELAGNAARDNKRSRITPRHILLAVANDEELNKLLRNVTIPSGGVMPHIHQELLKRKNDRSAIPTKAPVRKVKNAGVKKIQAPKKKPVAPTKKASAPAKAAPTKKAESTPENASPAKKVQSTEEITAPAKKAPTAPKEAASTTVVSEKTLFLGQKLSVVQGSITDVQCDAIVHPTNATFSTAGEVGGALLTQGGEALKKSIIALHESHGDLDYATALIGDAPNLQAKNIVHVHSPIWGKGNPEEDLETVVKNALTLADEKNLTAIAFPSIGCGNSGAKKGSKHFPKSVAAQTILKAISNYFVTVMASSLKQIYFVMSEMESLGVYTMEMARLESSA